jgi:HAMP domain-containing protein
MMSEDSGQYDARKLRKSPNFGTWVTLLGMSIAVAIAWGTNANRLQNVEEHTNRIEAHQTAADQQIAQNKEEIAVLKERLQYIIEQLQAVNAKLDRAEEERRK